MILQFQLFKIFSFTGIINDWILKFSYEAEYVLFSAVFYSGKPIQMS